MVANVHRVKDFELFLLSTFFLELYFPLWGHQEVAGAQASRIQATAGYTLWVQYLGRAPPTAISTPSKFCLHLRLELRTLGYSAQSPTDLGLWGQYMP